MDTRSSVPVTPTTTIEQEQDEQSRRCGAATVARLGSGGVAEWRSGEVEGRRGPRGSLLRHLRKSRGFTQNQLADKAGVSRTRLATVEADEEAVVRRSTARAILDTLHAVRPLTQSEHDRYYWHFRVTLPGVVPSSPAAGVAGETLCPSKAIGRSTAEHARRLDDDSGSLERLAIGMRRVEHAVRELVGLVEMETAMAARAGASVQEASEVRARARRYVDASVRLGLRPASLDGERGDLPGVAVAQETPGDDGHAGLLGGVVSARPFAEAVPTCGCCDPHQAKAGVA